MPVCAYLFNSASFAFEAFPEEVVILNVEQGSYFALGGWVLEVWPALIERQPVDRIVEAVARRYDVPVSVIGGELEGLLARLAQERILLEAEPGDAGFALDAAATGGTLRPLTFEKHDDLQDLITLDPIHDIDPEQGWPHVRP